MAKAVSAVGALSRFTKVSAAFVFGSQVEGRATSESDIDLAVFVTECDKWTILQRAQIAGQVQAEVADDIELHFFPASALEHCESASFAAYVLKHGVRVDDASVQRVAERRTEYRPQNGGL